MSHILQGKSLDLFYYGKLNNKVEEFGISRIGKLSEVPKGPSQTMWINKINSVKGFVTFKILFSLLWR